MNQKLSIGIPTFNQGEYIEKTILSVLNQTIQPYEFIICNNYSNDSTNDVLTKYQKDVKIISPPHHVSAAENFIYLAQHMKGDWVSIIGSDDYYEPNFVKLFYENINQNVVLFRFGFNLIDKVGRTIATKKIRSVRRIQSFPGNFYEQTYGPKTNLSAAIVKTSALREVGFFDENLKLIGDWGLYLRLSVLGKFQYCNEIVSNYRIGYRPTLRLDRFKNDTADKYYLYNVIQKDIIDKYGLNTKLYNNALRLHLYEMEQFIRENNLERFEAFEQFKALVPEQYIKSKSEYLLKNYYQRFNEMFIKR